ncbi:MAG: hypothetical protein XD50_1529 [Clostridia bacterium 41_269]|nr:MAG: hypothetical protein XD50_1529 [Clostridia bacterium 41_269]
MSLYHQLKHSGNPQAAVQTVISLLEKHSPKEVAEIMGISVSLFDISKYLGITHLKIRL